MRGPSAWLRAGTAPWTDAQWTTLQDALAMRVRAAASEDEAWGLVQRQARRILRTYSTSFFIVTRFLPPLKRAKVEVIYAAVRFPDEIVDTFPLATHAQLARLRSWGLDYDRALATTALKQNVESGVPALLAGFVSVVQNAGIPAEHYRAFLDAMGRDASPAPFASLNDLIEEYVYGSAVVVGFFLAHVYGARRPADWARAMSASRSLGIALQLTNFLRDVSDDQRRGRVYLPQDALHAAGIEHFDTADPTQRDRLRVVVTRVAQVADRFYDEAAQGLDAFAVDCQPAIGACIAVYRQLNTRIANSPRGMLHRERVPFADKFRVLPLSKYWRLPVAYLRA